MRLAGVDCPLPGRLLTAQLFKPCLDHDVDVLRPPNDQDRGRLIIDVGCLCDACDQAPIESFHRSADHEQAKSCRP